MAHQCLSLSPVVDLENNYIAQLCVLQMPAQLSDTFQSELRCRKADVVCVSESPCKHEGGCKPQPEEGQGMQSSCSRYAEFVGVGASSLSSGGRLQPHNLLPLGGHRMTLMKHTALCYRVAYDLARSLAHVDTFALQRRMLLHCGVRQVHM